MPVLHFYVPAQAAVAGELAAARTRAAHAGRLPLLILLLCCHGWSWDARARRVLVPARVAVPALTRVAKGAAYFWGVAVSLPITREVSPNLGIDAVLILLPNMIFIVNNNIYTKVLLYPIESCIYFKHICLA